MTNKPMLSVEREPVAWAVEISGCLKFFEQKKSAENARRRYEKVMDAERVEPFPLFAEQPAPVAESTHETREHIDADGRRYQWLRKTAEWEETCIAHSKGAGFVSSGTGMGNMCGEDLDKAIDSLIAIDNAFVKVTGEPDWYSGAKSRATSIPKDIFNTLMDASYRLPTYPISTAVLPERKLSLAFHGSCGFIGKLFENAAGKLEFEGDAEASALVMFNYLIPHFEDAIEGRGVSASAPVAVVMPERMKTEPFTTIDRGSKNYKAGYNAAIAEVAKLNGLKP